MKQEFPMFGEHHVGDLCPDCIQSDSFKDACIKLANHDISQIDQIRWWKEFGLRSLGRSRIIGRARERIREFITVGGIENDPLSSFSGDNLFDPNQFSPSTIIRLTEDINFLCDSPSAVLRQQSKMQDFHCPTINISWDNRSLSARSEKLGVVCESPVAGRNIVISFLGNEGDILERDTYDETISVPIDTNLWHHDGVWVSHPLNGKRYYQDWFYRHNKVEILQLGKAVKEKSPERVRQESRVFRPGLEGI